MNYRAKILVVDGDANIRKVLKKTLTKQGYNVLLSSDGRDGFSTFIKEEPILIILDLMLPVVNGYDLCLKIRQKSQVPIIILTSLQSISERIKSFDLGADDFITKPFSQSELEARIRSILRRTQYQIYEKQPANQPAIYIGDLVFNPTTQQVLKKQKKIKLTAIESHLLKFLILNAGEALSRLVILENIWGYKPERDGDIRVVDVHIARLRSKIEEDLNSPDLILTVRGIGYKFQDYS
jgi:OmpR family response regulator RpaB